VHKRNDWIKALFVIGAAILVFAAISLPFYGSGFVSTVIFNSEQSIVVQAFLPMGGLKIYVLFLLVLFAYAHFYSFLSVNRDLLLAFAGIVFSLFLVAVPPMPGWYVWIVPFAAIYLMRFNSNRHLGYAVFASLNILYAAYFVLFHKTGVVDLYFMSASLQGMKISNGFLRNATFTLLVGVLCTIMALFYKEGVISNAMFKRANRPFVFGVCGDSGSGKSTLLSLISDIFQSRSILAIEGDGDHKWARGDEMWKTYTHLNPKANHLHRQANDIRALKLGKPVRRMEYLHSTGEFSGAKIVQPKKYIVFSGLHSLYLPQIREVLDLKIFVDTDKPLQRYWKIKRDTQARRYSKEAVLAQIEAREEDVQLYIESQRQFADLIIQYFDDSIDESFERRGDSGLALRFMAEANLYLEGMLSDLSDNGALVRHDYLPDLWNQEVEIRLGGFRERDGFFEGLAQKHIANFDDLIRSPAKWRGGLDGIVQLLLLLQVAHKLRR
jgi:uridine kinase